MNSIASRTRRLLFVIGCLALGGSIVVLAATFFQSAAPADAFERARQSSVWLRYGVVSSVAGLALCLFGRGGPRGAAILTSLVVISFWCFLAMSQR